MTEPLSPDRLELLLPALGHVAEMVNKSGGLNRKALRLLLVGIGLEDEWALDELERWVRVLKAAQAASDAAERELAQRALMLRGIPEAAAMLAVSIAVGAGKEQSVPPPQRVSASVERLDMGTLSPGQGATAEFEVQGGPGRVVVESDQVRVTPQRFEAGATRVRVEVRPMSGGGVLWTTVRLITAGGTLEVPVVAQWMSSDVAEPPATPSPFVFRNGQQACTVEELVRLCEQSPDDAVYHLEGGHFEPWLADLGRADLAEVARRARQAQGSAKQRLKQFLDETGVPHNFRPAAPRVSHRATAVPAPEPKRRYWMWAVAGLMVLTGMIGWWVGWQQVQQKQAAVRAAATAQAQTTVAARAQATATAQAAPITAIRPENLDRVREWQVLISEGWVEDVAFSPDGKLLAWGGAGGAWIYDLAERRVLHHLTGHTAQVHCISFSPDGQSLVSSGAAPDRTTRFWDVTTGEQTRLLAGLPGGVGVGSKVSPLGDALVSTSGADWWITDIATGNRIQLPNPNGAIAWDVTWSPDGKLMAIAGSESNLAYLFRASTRSLLRTFRHSSTVGRVAFSPDGQVLAAQDPREVRLWRVDGELWKSLDMPAGRGGWGLAFSPDGQVLAIGLQDGTIKLWDMNSRIVTLSGRAAPVWRIAFSPDGTLMASGSNDGTVRLWGVR